MNTLQADAVRDDCAAIRKEAMSKYELMDCCLEEGDWMIAANYLKDGDRLMSLAARLEERQAKMPTVGFEAFIELTEREQLNRAAGLSS